MCIVLVFYQTQNIYFAKYKGFLVLILNFHSLIVFTSESVQGKSCLVRKYQHCHLGKRLKKYHHHLDFRYGAPAPPTFSVHSLHYKLGCWTP